MLDLLDSIFFPYIIIALLCVIIYTTKDSCMDFFTTTNIISMVDGRTYPVLSEYKDREEAANIIGHMNVFTVNLILLMKQNYIELSEPVPIYSNFNKNNSENNSENENIPVNFLEIEQYKKGRILTNILINKFNPNSLKENEPRSLDKTSFTVNKGEIISLCLREKQSGKNSFHDLNILKFVLLHELSHIVTPELQHTPLFWTNFKFLLEFCEKYKIYISPNYTKDNFNYCGLTVTYTPINDTTLVSYFKNV
jgi:WLM domain-containing protein